MEDKRVTEHIHKRLTEEQVRMIIGRYLKKGLSAKQGMDLLELKRRQFFEWVKRYKEQDKDFTIEYNRSNEHRRIERRAEENIIVELAAEKALIDNPSMPVRFYNYSFIKHELRKKYGQDVSLPTIINRAKKRVFTSQDPKRRYTTER
jgi:hypothetical protein